MKRQRTIFLILAIVLSTAPVYAGLTPHKAEYKVRISAVGGKLNTELRRTELGFVANHVIRPTGMMRLFSRGVMDVTSEFSSFEHGIKPISYTSIDTIRKDPDVNLEFDWSRNAVTGTVGTEPVSFQLEGLSHDSVSIQYQLMSDLLNGGASEHYTLFDIDKMRVTNVTNAGVKQIKTKAGTFEAVGVRHQKEGSSRVTTLWCVAELGYLPVVIEQHRKNKLKFRATLVKYTALTE